jgi:hypothetical protein
MVPLFEKLRMAALKLAEKVTPIHTVDELECD